MTSSKQKKANSRQSLGARSIRAGGWGFVRTFATFGLRLASNLIMTRLLLPDAFGMMALAVTVLTALNLMSDIGISQSIVREKEGGDTHFLRVAWVVKLIRSCFVSLGVASIAAALWILGPIYAAEGTVYARPEMPGLILLAAFGPILTGAASTTVELAGRELNYARVTLLDIASQIISILCMILFAQFSPTVWALMTGMLVGNLMRCLFSHTLMPGPKMRFEWDREISDKLWKFGKWILASSAVWFVANYADKLILGGLVGSATFGIYTIAQIWVEAAKKFISRIQASVGFPAIAEVYRERPHDVPRLFRKFQTVMDGICFLGFLTLLLGGPLLIKSLYSETYHTAGRYLQIMSLTFLILRFDTLMGLVLNTGNSKAMFGRTAIQAVAVLAGVPLGFSLFGVEGAIWAAVISQASVIPYILYHSNKILGLRQTLLDIAWAIMTLVAAMGLLGWLTIA